MWDNVLIGLIISVFAGWGLVIEICPKKKRGELANRITAIVALFFYSITVLIAIFMPDHEFSLKQFLLEGILVGGITAFIIYGIAQAIHWAIKGKWM